MTAKILFVDDEPDLEALIRQRFRRKIRDSEISFVFARDGVEALATVAETADIDMVVSDINMPRMDGLTLLGKLHEIAPKLSTVIVSAYGDMANIRNAMNKGAFDFLTKPIDFEDLETTIGKTMRHIGVLRDADQRQSNAEKAHAALSRYFSPNLAERLAADPTALTLAGQRRDISTLFTDIAGFTTLIESLDPAILGEILNEYLVAMTDVVFMHEGTVAKIVGDALHVLFNAPGDQPDNAALAVACSLDLDRVAEDFRARWRARGYLIGVTRIGVHAGSAIVGNFGGNRYFDYTAYGDTINTAARLEKANEQLGTRVCVSASVADRVAAFRGRPVGNLLLRGKSEALRVFEPLSEKAYGHETARLYRDAFGKLENNDPGALSAFAALVGISSEDPLANFHLRRLLNGGAGVRIVIE